MFKRYPHLFTFIKENSRHLKLFIFSVLCSVAYVYCSLQIPTLFGRVLDQITDTGNNDLFNTLLQRILFLAILSGIWNYLSSLLSNRQAYTISSDIRNKAFVHLQSLPLSHLDRQPIGKTLDKIISDVEIICEGMQIAVSQLVIGVATIVGTTISMLMLNPIASVVVILLTPLSLLLTRYLAKNTHDFFVKQSASRTAQTEFVEEMLSNENLIKSNERESITIDEFKKYNKEYVNSSEKATFFSSLTNPSTRLLNNVIYSLIAFIGALVCIKKGNLFTVGQFSALLAFSNQFGKPFNDISSVITELQNSFNSIENVYAFLDAPEESDSVSDKDHLAALGNVSIENVAFSYSPDTKLIQDFDIEIKKGQHIALVGPTGCGKTTVINLLMRFYDSYSGKILIDGIDSKSVTRSALRENYGMVLQDTWIKTASVKDNLSFAKPDASTEEIIKIARITKADDFIQRLPQGYETVIGEEGVSLSEGQRQLLCITRLFLTMPPIIILDEATSSVDTKTERDIYRSLEELLQGRTSFIVAHRLSTIESADMIIVMNAGKIVEKGNHKSLMDKKGFYYNLYQSQYSLIS
ncbi:MAG: ABC transporter ATP-binding protein [Oscillospiraceae bacterium]|nr:ABC transporter ATP-binding protein [Oscillospiraceae bacterium]